MQHIRSNRAIVSLGIFAFMVLIVTFGFTSILMAAFIVAILILLTGCCSAESARRSIDLETLLVIVAALALGKSMEVSGLAEILGHGMLISLGGNPYIMLPCVFVVTMLVGNMITAKAGAVLMLPINCGDRIFNRRVRIIIYNSCNAWIGNLPSYPNWLSNKFNGVWSRRLSF